MVTSLVNARPILVDCGEIDSAEYIRQVQESVLGVARAGYMKDFHPWYERGYADAHIQLPVVGLVFNYQGPDRNSEHSIETSLTIKTVPLINGRSIRQEWHGTAVELFTPACLLDRRGAQELVEHQRNVIEVWAERYCSAS